MSLYAEFRKWQLRAVGILLLLFLVWYFNKRVIDPRNENGMTALMVAADRGDAAAVRRLASKRGARKQVPSNALAAMVAFLSWMQSTPHHDVYWTALHYAARAQCRECVQTLLDVGAEVNATGRDGSTALLEAALKNNLELVQLLTARGADPTHPRLLFAALMHPDNVLLRFFLEHGARPDGLVPGTTLYFGKQQPLLVAVHQGRADAVRLLLEFNAPPEPRDPLNGYSALRIARRAELAEIEQMLRAAGAKDDGLGEERLLAAVKAGDAAALRAALEAGANANTNDAHGNPLICVAAEHGQTEMVAALLDHKASITARNNYRAPPLYLAISFKHPETAAFLLERGAPVEDAKYNPLHIAVHSLDFATATLLLDKGANIHFGNDAALRTAAKAANLEMVKFLLERGADPRGMNEEQENSLHQAAYRGSAELLGLLLDKGVDVNARQYTGQTALFYAAALGNVEGVRTLLERGADPNIRDEEGKSALDSAQRHPEVQTLLRAAGAK
ncbi:MAG: ankyrin repeat domain-containing protein [Terriglobales bacterium]